MMNVINDQREVLINLRSEVDTAEARLEKASRTTEKMVIKRNDAEKKKMIGRERYKKDLHRKGKIGR